MASLEGATDATDGPSPTQRPALQESLTHHGVLRAISPVECLELLEPGGIGRVGFASEEGVVMLPVNFAVCGNAIIFRTAPDTMLALHANAHLSFEVDHFDETLRQGWSVLVRGHAHQVTDEREVQQIEDGTRLMSWAPGARDVYVRIAPTHISGRSIRPS